MHGFQPPLAKPPSIVSTMLNKPLVISAAALKLARDGWFGLLQLIQNSGLRLLASMLVLAL